MKGRPSKTTVDYFPHQTSHKKTIFTLESLYKNDGYAFWFKLLEILGSSEGHVFRFENTADWLFLVAKSGVSEEKANLILKTLADLDAIDGGLLEEKVIWSENFVQGLIPVYDKSSTGIPVKPTLRREKGLNGEKTPQSKVKESKGEKKQPLTGYSDKFLTFWKAYPNKQGKFKAFASWKKYKCDNGIFNSIMESLEEHKQSDKWLKNDGQYIPHGLTWVNGKGWEDSVTTASGTKDCTKCAYRISGSCKVDKKDCGSFSLGAI